MPTAFHLPLALAVFAAGTPVVIDGLKSTTPEGWKEVPTSSSMRFKQFEIPRAEGDPADAELIIFFFGAGQGGDAASNVERWKKMFDPVTGNPKVENAKIGKVNATILDIRGTYLYKPMPMAPKAEPRPNHRMVAVVFESPQGPYFIRFVGPEKTIDKRKKDFDKWLRGFK
jgi:hypothetical protein